MIKLSDNEFTQVVVKSKSFCEVACNVGVNYNVAVVKYIKQKICILGIDTSHFKQRNINSTSIPERVLRAVVIESKSFKEVMKKCGISGSVGCSRLTRRIRGLSIPTTHFRLNCRVRCNSKMDLVDDETFRTIVKGSSSWWDLAKKLGCYYYDPEDKQKWIDRAVLIAVDMSHLTRKIKTLNEIFVINSSANGTMAKRKIIHDLKWPYKCAICNNDRFDDVDGMPFWQNKPVVLQLDHINGINKDHRLENLRLLCVLCHAQTSTYNGKNMKKTRDYRTWVKHNGEEVVLHVRG